MEMWFQNRLKKARDYHLCDAIRNRRYTQRPRSPVTFWNLDTTDRRREIAA